MSTDRLRIEDTALVELLQPGTWVLHAGGPWGAVNISARREIDYVYALMHARNLITLELNRLPRAEDRLEDALAGERRHQREEFSPAADVGDAIFHDGGEDEPEAGPEVAGAEPGCVLERRVWARSTGGGKHHEVREPGDRAVREGDRVHSWGCGRLVARGPTETPPTTTERCRRCAKTRHSRTVGGVRRMPDGRHVL